MLVFRLPSCTHITEGTTCLSPKYNIEMFPSDFFCIEGSQNWNYKPKEMIQIFTIIHNKIIKLINETSVWEKRMLKCRTSNKNAIISVQVMPNLAVSVTDKAASDTFLIFALYYTLHLTQQTGQTLHYFWFIWL